MMTDKEILKKQIIYRSEHRGIKEMDLLLGGFVRKYVDEFNINELKELEKILFIDDKTIYNWYFQNNSKNVIQRTKVSDLLKKFRI